MKKLRVSVLALVITGALGILTACGKVPEPTKDDVIKALVDEDIMSREQKKEGKFEVEIDKVDINDDQDRATVNCSLIINDGPLSQSTEYEIKFSIRDDKESWKVRKGKVEAGDVKTELTEEISDEEIKKLFEYESFSAEDNYIVLNDESTTYEIGEHKLDKEARTDTVIIKGTVDEGYRKIEFNVEYVFMYSGKWYIADEEVAKVEEEYSEEYDLSDIKMDDIVSMFSEDNEYYYIMGYEYKLDNKNLKISDAVLGEIEYDAESADVPISFKVAQGDVSFKVDTIVGLEFNEESSEWEFYYSHDTVISEFTCGLVGTWNGSDEAGNSYILKISNTFVEDSKHLSANVSVTTSAGENYSYTAYIYSYDVEEGDIAINSDEWVKKPGDTNISMTNFDLKIEGTTLKPEWSWDSYTFTKAQ